MRTRLTASLADLRMSRGLPAWLVALSFFDAIATDTGLRIQAIQEANPFAAMLYDTDILLFYAYKLILPLILLTLVRRVIRPSFITKWVLPVTMLYGIVAVYHIAWLVIVLAGWQ